MKLSKFLSSLFILLIFLLPKTMYADSCNHPTLLNVPGTASGHLKSNKPNRDREDYFKFTVPADGTIHLYSTGYDSSSDMDGWIVTSDCSSYYVKDNSYNSNIDMSMSVTKNSTYKVLLYAYSGNSDYTLHIDLTRPTPSCSTLRDSKNLTSADTTYTNAPHYNNSYWNVGPSATSNSRAYKFSVDSAGQVAIDLSRIDRNQASFSVSKGACPATFDNLKNSQLDFTSAGDFYVYIYYLTGSHSNIEHQLDVVFTPSIHPVITPATFSISENAKIGTIVGTVNITGNPTSVSMSGDDNKFSIDTNGVIRVKNLLDYETKSSYTLTMTATNSVGSSPATDITVNIINELPPTAIDQTFNVDESAPNGTLIGTIVATGNPTIFTIMSGNTNSAFALDNDGNITVNDTSVLDATTTPQYTLLVHIESPEGSVDINATVNVDSTLPTGDDNRRDFTNVSLMGNDSISINGNIIMIGNQLLCQNSADGAKCTAPSVNVQNNGIYQHKVKIDTSTNAPSNNSWAKLSYETGTNVYAQPDEVIFARLYWSARLTGSVGTTLKNKARKIQIKGPKSTTYTTLTSPVSKFNWYKGIGWDYAASQDVTAYVKQNGPGKYSVGGIQATNGENRFASWVLIVIVQNPDRDLNNLSIYDGFQSVYSGSGYPTSITVPASGFLTPTGSEPFKASLFAYTGESENNLQDYAQIQDSSGRWHSLTDGYNNVNEVFNASVYTPENGFRSDHAGEADPNFKNIIGQDIDKLEINRKADASKQFLDHSQTSTKIKIGSKGDQYTLNLFAFETELHYPKLCYDYSYTQDGYVYTELNNGKQKPYITIPSNSGSPVDISIYIKSLDNDVNFDHVSIYSDMNLSEVVYDGGFRRTNVNAFGYNPTESEYSSPNCLEAINNTKTSCKTTYPSGNFRTAIGRPDASGNLGYPLASAGSMGQDDFMYFKYSVLPKNSGYLHSPLNLFADIQYSLVTGGLPVDPITGLPFGGKRMPLCPPSTSYTPEWGIFNVIDSNINATRTGLPRSRYLNNLLTQVVNRPFTADVVALDPVTNPPNSPIDINTSVAVELVDIKGFHDVNISCKEPAVSFSKRAYLNFGQKVGEENRITISNLSTTFAKQDAAYRIWYIHDGNTSHLIKNWTAQTDASGKLLGVTNLYEQIPGAPDVCWSDCDGAQSPAKQRSPKCYECLRTNFGYPLCSRDNFAIRPESFHVVIKDANNTSSLKIIDNNANNIKKLAAGYNYMLDVNATNHIDNNNSRGYNKQFLLNGGKSFSQLRWINNSTLTCNNEANKSMPILLSNGAIVNYNFTNPDVGKYSMKIHDSEWTTVDQGMPDHHENNQYWIYSQPDCNDNSIVTDITAANPEGYVGCNIDSQHTVDRTLTGSAPLAYYDANITFKPYRFNVNNIIISHGTDFNATFPTTAPFAYVYMSDMKKETNMSLNAIGTIIAEGKDGNTLTNYTKSCYADNLTFTLGSSVPVDGDETEFTTRYLDINATSSAITSDTNISALAIAPNNIFHDDANGISTLRLHFNYDRNSSNALNPKQIFLKDFNVTCTTLTECQMIADQNLNYEAHATKDINKSLNFYYGRTHAPRQKFTTPVGESATNPAKAFIYYEIYCNGATCDKTLLPDGSTSKTSDDPRWFINTQHTVSLGSAFNVRQRNASDVTTKTDPSGNAPDFAEIYYTGSKGYPYKTTMENNASSWLIYNQYNPTTKTNEFQVEFLNGAANWSGAHETNTTTVNGGTSITNRRLMW